MKIYKRIHFRNILKFFNFNYFGKWHQALEAGKHAFVNRLANFPHSPNNFQCMLQNIKLQLRDGLTYSLSYEFP